METPPPNLQPVTLGDSSALEPGDWVMAIGNPFQLGINVAIVDDDTGGNIGIGFAVPINSVKALLPQVRQGKVVRGQLGVEFHDGPILEDEAVQLGLPSAAGALVMTVVVLDSPADEASLAAGDVIRAINRHPVHSAAEATAELRRIEPRKPIFLHVWRHGTEVFLQMRKD